MTKKRIDGDNAGNEIIVLLSLPLAFAIVMSMVVVVVILFCVVAKIQTLVTETNDRIVWVRVCVCVSLCAQL